MKKLLVITLSLFLLVSCETNRQHKREKVHVYKAHNTQTQSDDSWIYWYVIYMNNSTVYSTSSSAPITNFSTVSWNRTSTVPQELKTEIEENEVTELATEEVAETNFSEEMQEAVESEPDDEAADTSTESDAGSTDGGSSDSGSSDGGGGDGGGGD